MEKFPVALFACLLSAGRGLVNFLKIKRVEEGEPYGVLKVLKSGLLVWAYPLLPLGIAFGLSDCLAETKALDKGGVFVIWGFAALGSHCIHACCRCAFIGEEE